MSENKIKKVDYLKAAKQYHSGNIASYAQSCALIAIAEQMIEQNKRLTRIADALEKQNELAELENERQSISFNAELYNIPKE